MKKISIHIPLPLCGLLGLLSASCAESDFATPTGETAGNQAPEGFYIRVDLPEAQPETRLSYAMQDDPLAGEKVNIETRWQLGDFIKIYEMPDVDEVAGSDPSNPYPGPADNPHQTHVFTDYEDYAEEYPFPSAPSDDLYYRFKCIGGEGTAHGIFQYMGLAHVTVDYTVVDGETLYNMDLDLIPDHKIRNWEKFDGLVVYGNPLRNYMMRHQSANDNMEHLKYGQRMKGHICAYNFNGWYNPNADNVEDPETDSGEEGGEEGGGESERPALTRADGDTQQTSADTAGTRGLLLYNTASCVIKVVLGGFEDEIYGGATVEIDMEGITNGHKNSEGEEDEDDPRNNPMTLLLGNKFDHQELLDPWCWAAGDTQAGHASKKTITAYVMAWPGTLEAGKEVKVSLDDPYYGKRYTWTLTKDRDIEFLEGHYYIFDITNTGKKPVITTIPQTTP